SMFGFALGAPAQGDTSSPADRWFTPFKGGMPVAVSMFGFALGAPAQGKICYMVGKAEVRLS
ncbi:MAG: hypothetical protein KDD64_08235, partial [Bdellovibrionales bacterium]|nr:hypothetical protein [Bdellovibrionales bacterium]